MTESAYVAVTNIPNDFHAADLRAYFSAFVETGSFTCFHYRHRPEKRANENETTDTDTSNSKSKSMSTKSMFCCVVIKLHRSHYKDFEQRYNDELWTDATHNYSIHRCSISMIQTERNGTSTSTSSCPGVHDSTNYTEEDKLLSMPELKPPDLMPNGNVGTPTRVFLDFIQRCLLPDRLILTLQLKFPKTEGRRIYSNVNYDYLDRKKENNGSNRSGKAFPHSNKPNDERTKGAAKHDTEECGSNNDNAKASRLVVVKRSQDNCEKYLNNSRATSGDNPSNQNLCKEAETSHNLLYANNKRHSSETDFHSATSGDNTSIQNNLTKKELRKLRKMERKETVRLMDENIEEHLIAIEKKYHNDEDAEEWDRHEAIEDDPSNQERNKERLYEEEIEQPWEKGGPGVVFYTDAMYWQAREGDFDEQTADDLDVDFSPYEGDGPGDKDIRDFLKIRQERRFRSGHDKTDRFSIGLSTRPVPDDRPTSFSSLSLPGPSAFKKPSSSNKIGQFEIHTKGVGRKILEKQGWMDGQGLGKSQSGIKQALRGEGQRPHKKKGLGFVKPEVTRYGPPSVKKVKGPNSHLITTVLDSPHNTDPKEKLLERQEPTTLKYRKSFLDKFPPGP